MNIPFFFFFNSLLGTQKEEEEEEEEGGGREGKREASDEFSFAVVDVDCAFI